jgi:MarR family transcriptional regulator, lower aerobic nicotinate degradation pathway regulator
MAPASTDLQRVPHALRASPGFLLGKAAQQGAELAERALRPLALKARHYGVLVTLRDHGPLAQHELGQLLRIDRTTMVAVVDHLERLGFVRRGLQPADRRTYQVQLTTAGQAALAQAYGAITGADAALVARLSAQERAQLVMLLHKLCGLE